MRAIILAAGRGSRMKNLTAIRPKCLVEVKDRPLLAWQISALREAGIAEIGIVTGYMRDLLANSASREFHNPAWDRTNMVSSLACAEEWLEEGPVVVSYSDIFYHAEAVTALINCQDHLAVTYDPNWLILWTNRFVDPLQDAETFRLNSDFTLAEIGNKPRSVGEVQGQYMGLLRIEPQGWAEIKRIRANLEPGERDRMHMTGTLQRVIEAGRLPVRAISYAGEWGEVDSAEDLAYYHSQQ